MTLLILFVIIQISEQFVFVGGDVAGKHIYNRGSQNGKRVQSNMGAKNHGVILPNAKNFQCLQEEIIKAYGEELEFTDLMLVSSTGQEIPCYR